MDKSVILMKSMPDKSQKWSDASNKFSKIRCKAVWVFPFVISTAWRILMKLDQSIDDELLLEAAENIAWHAIRGVFWWQF